MELVELGSKILAVTSACGSLPRSIDQGGHHYQRFMDRLFLPCSTESLSLEQINVINRFRESCFDSDAQFLLNQSVKRRIGTALDAIGCLSVVEIGCGRFPIKPF